MEITHRSWYSTGKMSSRAGTSSHLSQSCMQQLSFSLLHPHLFIHRGLHMWSVRSPASGQNPVWDPSGLTTDDYNALSGRPHEGSCLPHALGARLFGRSYGGWLSPPTPQTSIVHMSWISAFLTQTPPSGDSVLEAMAEALPRHLHQDFLVKGLDLWLSTFPLLDLCSANSCPPTS